MPLAVIAIHRRLKAEGLRAVLINSVHDSVVLDAPADEVNKAAAIMAHEMRNVRSAIEKRYGYAMQLDLECEIKAGPNWLDTKELS